MEPYLADGDLWGRVHSEASDVDPCQPLPPCLCFPEDIYSSVLFFPPPRHVDPGQRLPLPVRHHRGHHVLLHGGPQASQGLPGSPPVAGGEDEPGGAEPAAGVIQGLGGAPGEQWALGLELALRDGVGKERGLLVLWARAAMPPPSSSLGVSGFGSSSSSSLVPGAPPVYLSPSGGGPACLRSLFTGLAPA